VGSLVRQKGQKAPQTDLQAGMQVERKEEEKKMSSYWANETGLTVGPGDIVGPAPDKNGQMRWVVVKLDPTTKKLVFRWGRIVAQSNKVNRV
jgi:hypothetical protein